MGITIKDYDSYEQYLEHQKEKTGDSERRERLATVFDKRRNYFVARFSTTLELHVVLMGKKSEKTVCLGSRMGEEVAALQDLGFRDCIGTDLIARPPYVVVDDFHDLSLEADSIGLFYTNSLDHSYNPLQMFREVARCLRTGGYFIIDFFPGHMGKYEACRIDAVEEVNSAMPSELN